jgi:hypothetical protein
LVDKMKEVYGGYFLDALGGFLSELLDDAALRAKERLDARRFKPRRGVGVTLRPGRDTPLWNRMRTEMRGWVRKRGDQVKLARVLGLPRQQVNAFLTRGSRMPDAERTLMILAWLAAARAGRPMS